MFRPHLSYIAAISVNRRTSGYPWRGGPVRSDFQWCLLYPVNLRCLARSGRWRQRSSKWLGMLVIMLWTRCQVLISHLHNSWILNHSNPAWTWLLICCSKIYWASAWNIAIHQQGGFQTLQSVKTWIPQPHYNISNPLQFFWSWSQ